MITVYVVHGLNKFNFPEYHFMQNYTLPKNTKDAAAILHDADPKSSIVMFDGGEDVSPELYGETDFACMGTNLERDMRETFLYHVARAHDLKIFALCRGHQFVAVMNGGTLYQDYPSQLGTGKHPYQHTVNAVHPDWRLIMQETNYTVTSTHHQAVCGIPHNAHVSLVAPDLVCEGLVYPWGATVQSHPEYLDHFAMIEYVAGKFL